MPEVADWAKVVEGGVHKPRFPPSSTFSLVNTKNNSIHGSWVLMPSLWYLFHIYMSARREVGMRFAVEEENPVLLGGSWLEKRSAELTSIES